MIRILLVDDQTLVRQGIQTLLDLEEDLTVVGAAANGQQALALVEQLQPDVVLMDVRMPVMDGVAATREITHRWPHIGVIILTTFDDDEYVIEGLKAGARGYMLKDADSSEIVEAVRVVARGEALIQPSITRKVLAEFTRLAGARAPVASPLAEPLTEREMDVLRGIAAGQSNREIADQLCISEGTVKNHVSNLLAKLAVRDRTQAIIRARELGLIE
ncbi:response regulator transcription factor [Chloroflexus sp.]|uniref:response regulator transcription factor n=1 Tax=Chloroflexus sp. TaxID=1904827 RepID=UPI00298F1307|nr:response regulator transcription factor [Chloroflexus sp.]MCS6888561.1 response regulator transcription factor [Chloroflexus sp.]MCX7859311.1 response regulator transcription factor [Chloroflexus sp.]MDW8404513.1 response regulator transcription factor [Chloroflexus sp.]